jgi:hypothetical protein
LQRLYSTFANGWPGLGIVVLRLILSAFLIHNLFSLTSGAGTLIREIPTIAAASAGVFLFIGIWTPVAGVITCAVELWFSLSRPGEFWSYLLASAIASSLALLGPGAWSGDAIAYGRKRISIAGK